MFSALPHAYRDRRQEDGVERWMSPEAMRDEDAWRYGPDFSKRAPLIAKLSYIEQPDGSRLYCKAGSEQAAGWFSSEGCNLEDQPVNSRAMLQASKTAPGRFKKGKVSRPA